MLQKFIYKENLINNTIHNILNLLKNKFTIENHLIKLCIQTYKSGNNKRYTFTIAINIPNKMLLKVLILT